MVKGRKTGGRTKGTPNKATADVKVLAQDYSAMALKTLADIAKDKQAPAAARVSAANALLDRAHGRPPQALTGPAGAPLLPRDTNAREIIAERLNGMAMRMKDPGSALN